jgi:hypothetical protein
MTQSITDRLLLPLVAAMADGQFTALSADILDTLLWREIPEPKDIFYLVGARVFAKHLSALGFGHLVDPERTPIFKMVMYSHGDSRYHAVEV